MISPPPANDSALAEFERGLIRELISTAHPSRPPFAMGRLRGRPRGDGSESDPTPGCPDDLPPGRPGRLSS